MTSRESLYDWFNRTDDVLRDVELSVSELAVIEEMEKVK